MILEAMTRFMLLLWVICACSIFTGSNARVVLLSNGTQCSLGRDEDGVAVVSAWGHIYLSGGLEEIEFYTAAFSNPLPCFKSPDNTKIEFILAEPLSACSPLRNTHVGGAEGKAIIVERGTCSFSEKISQARTAGARVVIIINTDNSLVPISDPNVAHSADYSEISTILIRKRAGMLLLNYLSNQMLPKLTGEIIGEYYDSWKVDGSDEERLVPCGACSSLAINETVRVEYDVTNYSGKHRYVTGGILALQTTENDLEKLKGFEIGDLEYEFFSSTTGSPLPIFTDISITEGDSVLRLFRTQPNNGCEPLYYPTPVDLFGIGFGLLIDRGGCTFLKKLEHAYELGASFVIFINDNEQPLVVPLIEINYTIPVLTTIQEPYNRSRGYNGVSTSEVSVNVRVFDNSPTFSYGSLLPSIIVRYSAGKAINQMINTFRHAMFQIIPTSVNIGEYDEVASMYDVSYWNPTLSERELQFKEAILRTTAGSNLSTGRINEITKLYAFANEFYSCTEPRQ